MVVCSFFLRGCCRYGSACKFEHTLYENPNQGTSILRQQQNVPQNSAKSNVDTATLVRSVQGDMVNAEKGGQWLLSSYAPFKEKPLFEGFDDKAPEEVRFEYYEAAKNGKLEEYKRHLQGVLQNAMMKIRALQNPTPEVTKILENIYNSVGTKNQNVFTQNQQKPSASVFQTQTPNSNLIFGAVSTGNNVFSSINNTLGPTSGNQSSIFGNQAASNANPSIFGGAPSGGSIFQPPQANTSTFGSTQFGQKQANVVQNPQSLANASPFSAATNSQFPATNSQFPPAQNSPFATNNSPFNANTFASSNSFPNNSPFTTNVATNNTSPFAATNPQFSTNTTSTSIFQATNTNSLFGATTGSLFQPNPAANSGQMGVDQKPTSFGAQNFNQMQQKPAENVFAMHNAQNSSPFGLVQNSNSPFAAAQGASNSPFANIQAQMKQQDTLSSQTMELRPAMGNEYAKDDPNIYSKHQDLSEADLKAFESPTFEMGKIPTVPPSHQLCF